jgi:hypothetical protein
METMKGSVAAIPSLMAKLVRKLHIRRSLSFGETTTGSGPDLTLLSQDTRISGNAAENAPDSFRIINDGNTLA